MKAIFIMLMTYIFVTGCQQSDDAKEEKFTAVAIENQSAIAPAIELASNIDPDQLKIGPVDAPLCAKPVTVLDPEMACQQNNCSVKAFYSGLIPVQKNQRAIQVFDCGNAEVQPLLLTDREPRFNSTAILILQNTRDGENLWRQSQEGDQYQIELATEAAEGVLSLNSQGLYEWTELPD
ncbi:hypothetical protein EV673_2917 [Limnobacter thiooxidans]|nr:hypothetical protein EV673_2917 [Limnobacter thiooxidans]